MGNPTQVSSKTIFNLGLSDGVMQIKNLQFNTGYYPYISLEKLQDGEGKDIPLTWSVNVWITNETNAEEDEIKIPLLPTVHELKFLSSFTIDLLTAVRFLDSMQKDGCREVQRLWIETIFNAFGTLRLSRSSAPGKVTLTLTVKTDTDTVEFSADVPYSTFAAVGTIDFPDGLPKEVPY